MGLLSGFVGSPVRAIWARVMHKGLPGMIQGFRELLFANRRAAALRHTDFLNYWRPACDGTPTHAALGGTVAGTLPPLCPGLRFHDLRHTHKNMLIELDAPEILHDERLGHHPPGMRAIYAHTTPAMRKQMIDGLERVWANEGKTFPGPLPRPAHTRGLMSSTFESSPPMGKAPAALTAVIARFKGHVLAVQAKARTSARSHVV